MVGCIKISQSIKDPKNCFDFLINQEFVHTSYLKECCNIFCIYKATCNSFLPSFRPMSPFSNWRRCVCVFIPSPFRVGTLLMEVPGTPIVVSFFKFELKPTGKDSVDPTHRELQSNIVAVRISPYMKLALRTKPKLVLEQVLNWCWWTIKK